MIIFAIILFVLAFKVTGFALRAGFRLLGVGILLIAFMLLTPLLGLLVFAVPVIFILGLVTLVMIIKKAVSR